mmetsp:Transcript_30447/g.50248  ORF Transcript_30447/g.50248 Transcript_30447/m.50248 type:complete len:223 (-) Transcript_30447:82-750(-)
MMISIFWSVSSGGTGGKSPSATSSSSSMTMIALVLETFNAFSIVSVIFFAAFLLLSAILCEVSLMPKATVSPPCLTVSIMWESVEESVASLLVVAVDLTDINEVGTDALVSFFVSNPVSSVPSSSEGVASSSTTTTAADFSCGLLRNEVLLEMGATTAFPTDMPVSATLVAAVLPPSAILWVVVLMPPTTAPPPCFILSSRFRCFLLLVVLVSSPLVVIAVF